MSYYKSVDIRVTGLMSTLKEFVRVLAYLQKCSRLGTCRTIPVQIDGDGSGKIKFAIIDPDGGEPTELDVSQIKIPEDGSDIETQYIGE